MFFGSTGTVPRIFGSSLGLYFCACAVAPIDTTNIIAIINACNINILFSCASLRYTSMFINTHFEWPCIVLAFYLRPPFPIVSSATFLVGSCSAAYLHPRGSCHTSLPSQLTYSLCPRYLRPRLSCTCTMLSQRKSVRDVSQPFHALYMVAPSLWVIGTSDVMLFCVASMLHVRSFGTICLCV